MPAFRMVGGKTHGLRAIYKAMYIPGTGDIRRAVRYASNSVVSFASIAENLVSPEIGGRCGFYRRKIGGQFCIALYVDIR